MVITYGKRLYGTLDKIDGSFITTRFFHLSFLPLFPLESHLVFVLQAERGSISLVLTGAPVDIGLLAVVARRRLIALRLDRTSSTR